MYVGWAELNNTCKVKYLCKKNTGGIYIDFDKIWIYLILENTYLKIMGWYKKRIVEFRKNNLYVLTEIISSKTCV